MKLHQVIDEHFIAPSNGPRATYITAATWDLRCTRLALKRRVHMTSWDKKWIAIQAAFQKWRTGTDLLSQWWHKRDLLYDVYAAALSFSGWRLKQQLQQDKNAYLADVAKAYGGLNGSDIQKKLKSAGIGRRSRATGTKNLSHIHGHDDGRTRREELDTLWLDHFSKQEMGQVMTIDTFLQEAASNTVPIDELYMDVDLVPTCNEVERLCQSTATGKAPGLDNLPGELFCAAPQALARFYQPLMAKAILAIRQPIQWRGGLLHDCYKGAGSATDPDSYRSLFVSSVAGKMYHRHLRQRLGNFAADNLADLHLGAKKGAPVTLAALSALLLTKYCKADKWSYGLLFLDIKSAYYRVVRELAVGPLADDSTIIRIFQRFGLEAGDLHDLMQTIKDGGVFAECHMSSHLRHLAKDLMHNSWFVTPYSKGNCLSRTVTGSRPGETWADLIFSFIFKRVLESVRQYATDDGALLQLPFSGEQMPWGVQQQEMVAFLAAAWADDAVFPTAGKDAHDMVQQMQTTAKAVMRACLAHGLEPNLKPGKTSILLCLRGRGSRKTATEFFGDGGKSLVCTNAQGEFRIPVVPQYKHLGGVLDHGGDGIAEARRRAAVASAAFEAKAKQLFLNSHIDKETRYKLFPGTVVSTYFNLGLWTPFGKAWDILSKSFSKLARKLLRPDVDRDNFFRLPPAVVFEKTGIYPLEIYAAQRRIGLLRGIIMAGGDVSWALLQTERQWVQQLQMDFHTVLPCADRRPDFTPATWPLWWHLLKSDYDKVKDGYKKGAASAFKQYLAREAVRLHLAQMHREAYRCTGYFRSEYPWVCAPCSKGFGTKAGLATHFFAVHGRRAAYRYTASGSVCRSCGRDFHGYPRLLLHLRASVKCVMTLRSQGHLLPTPHPGIDSRFWRQACTDQYNPAPPRQVQPPVPFPEAAAVMMHEIVDQAYYDICNLFLDLGEFDDQIDGHAFLLEAFAKFPLFPAECFRIAARIREDLRQLKEAQVVAIWPIEQYNWMMDSLQEFEDRFTGFAFDETDEMILDDLGAFTLDTDWHAMIRHLDRQRPSQVTPEVTFRLSCDWEAGFSQPSNVMDVPALCEVSHSAKLLRRVWGRIVQGYPTYLAAPATFRQHALFAPFKAAAEGHRLYIIAT